jgi:AAA family ATP:ADP antiporter
MSSLPPLTPPAPRPRSLRELLARLWSAEPAEVPLVLWAGGFFFCFLCGYFVLRPLRDALGSEQAGSLGNVFQWTFEASLLAWPLVGLLLTKVRRRRLMPWFFRLASLQLLLIWGVWRLLEGPAHYRVAHVFFVWLSVFNVFAVSLFWGLMTDLFEPGQARRLFGAIAAGGTLGAIAATGVTRVTTAWLPAESLFVVGAVLFELGVQCARRLLRAVPTDVATAERGLGGSMEDGFMAVTRSPYLQRLCVYMAFFSLTGTLLYLGNAELAQQSGMSRERRTEWFSDMNLAYNLLTVPLQLLASGRLLVCFGIPATLAALPALVSLGFGVVGFATTFLAFSVLEVLRRVCHYAVSKPAMDVMFTVVSRAEKYKARSFIDTVVFRGSDWVAGVGYDRLRPLTTLPALTFGLVPLSLCWAWIAWRAGRQMERRSAAAVEPAREGDAAA